jgi:hypothetical protein
LHKTIDKLIQKGIPGKATTSKVRFYRPDRDKLEEAWKT